MVLEGGAVSYERGTPVVRKGGDDGELRPWHYNFTAIRKDAGLCCGSRLREGRSVCLCWAPSQPKGPKKGPKAVELAFVTTSGEVSRGEKMTLRGTDPESYITEHTLVYEEYGRDLTSTVPRASPRAICTVLLDLRDPSLQSERRQGFAADPVYGRAKCLPMLGSLKT